VYVTGLTDAHLPNCYFAERLYFDKLSFRVVGVQDHDAGATNELVHTILQHRPASEKGSGSSPLETF